MIGNKTGRLGEDIVELFLKRQGYSVFTRNYLKKYGEIDIVAKKGSKWHFVEVKTVSREPDSELDEIRPEDNVHGEKLRKLANVIQVFIQENRVVDWQFDVAIVYLDKVAKKASVKILENEILEVR